MILKYMLIPGYKFILGALFASTISVVIIFFPFPKGRTISLVVLPLMILSVFLMEKYTQCSVIFPVSIIRVFQRKTTITSLFWVTWGMFFGAYYVAEQIRNAIQYGALTKMDQFFQERLLLSLNEVCMY